MKKKILAVALVMDVLCALAVTAYAAGSVTGPTTPAVPTSPKTGFETYAGLLVTGASCAAAPVAAVVKSWKD